MTRSLLLLVVAASTAAAQQVPTKNLGKMDAEYTEPFTDLRPLVELRDGRVVVADPREKTLQAIDFKSGRATAIGREGNGPAEWGLPSAVYSWRGDSVLLNDRLNSRYLVISPDGRPVRTYNPIADAAVASATGATGSGAARAGDGRGGDAGGRASGGAAGRASGGAAGRASGDAGGRASGGGGAVVLGGRGGGPRVMGGLNARGVDSRGRIYSQDLAISIGNDGAIKSADSAAILRLDPATNKTDTVAYVNLAKDATSGSVRGNAGNTTMQIRIGGGAPFAAADDWTVLRDGSVVILRVADYHLEIVSPSGQRVVGRPVVYTPVRVTEADKQQWRDARRNASGLARTTVEGGGRAPTTSASTVIPPMEEPASWPDVKPPFMGSPVASAAFPAPNGDVWVTRTRSANDKIPTADVFDGRGRLIGKMSLPEGTRLVGFGKNFVYVARTDADDLQYLQRYPITWTGCAPEIREVCRP